MFGSLSLIKYLNNSGQGAAYEREVVGYIYTTTGLPTYNLQETGFKSNFFRFKELDKH
jgi:hypothetical protein